MITVSELSRAVASVHGIDDLSAATAVVWAHLTEVRDDPDFYDTGTGAFTADGAAFIIESINQSYQIGAVSTIASDLLRLIEESTGSERDAYVRSALRTELRRVDIAAAAGVAAADLDRIRDSEPV